MRVEANTHADATKVGRKHLSCGAGHDAHLDLADGRKHLMVLADNLALPVDEYRRIRNLIGLSRYDRTPDIHRMLAREMTHDIRCRARDDFGEALPLGVLSADVERLWQRNDVRLFNRREIERRGEFLVQIELVVPARKGDGGNSDIS